MKKAFPELIDLAETRAGPRCDNVSVLAIELARQGGPRAGGAGDGADGRDATDVATRATDPDFLRMTDADIERAIAEIKKALQEERSGARNERAQ